MTMRLGGLLGDERGTSTLEFVLVAMVFFIFVLGLVDFSRLLWQWNRAEKATQFGARWAVVNDMVVQELQNYDGIADGIGNGQPVPTANVNGGNPIICDVNGCSNGFTKVDAAFDQIVDRMQILNNAILPEHVVVEYQHIGMGFSGNPFGADIVPLVTVRLQGMTFEFVTLALATGASFTMPGFRTVLTGEDYQS